MSVTPYKARLYRLVEYPVLLDIVPLELVSHPRLLGHGHTALLVQRIADLFQVGHRRLIVHARSDEAPFIVLTGNDGPELLNELASTNCIGYINKPYKEETLKATIYKHFGYKHDMQLDI